MDTLGGFVAMWERGGGGESRGGVVDEETGSWAISSSLKNEVELSNEESHVEITESKMCTKGIG